MKPTLYLCLFLFCFVSACTPKIEKRLKEQMISSPTTESERQKNQILQYAIENKMDVQSTASGIYYTITKKVENADHPKKTDILSTHYAGRLINGDEFDSSYKRDEPFELQLDRVIKGWQEAIPLLKKGEKGTFIIPSELAYGERGAGEKIPSNSVLVFDIELLDFFDPKEATMRQSEKERKAMEDYIAKNNLSGYKMTESGIFYKIDNPGEGTDRPNANSNIVAHYHGTLLDGTKFDSSYDRNEPLKFKLSRVVKGWQEAIPLLGKGGKGTFLIPSHLAYGKRGAGQIIKPNSTLKFDIELIDF